MARFTCLVLFALIASGCGPTLSTIDVHPTQTVDGLTFWVPYAWINEKPSSEMRRAQYVLRGEAGDATLVVYYFGPSTAGTVEANMERWAEQIDDDAPVRDRLKSHGLPVHTITARGRYIAAVRPGSDDHHDEPDWMLRAAVIETDDGPYYVKAVGPEATMLQHLNAIDMFLLNVSWEAGANESGTLAHP